MSVTKDMLVGIERFSQNLVAEGVTEYDAVLLVKRFKENLEKFLEVPEYNQTS